MTTTTAPPPAAAAGPTPEALAQLKAAHGEIYRLTAKLDGVAHVALVRVATPGEWARFTSMVADAAKRAQALDVLLRQCWVWPDAAGMDAMLTAKPGLVETYGNRLVEICGLVGQAEAEKL